MFQRLYYVMFSVPCYPGCSILSTTNFLVDGHFTCWFPACPNRENLFTLSHPSPCQLQAHLLPGEHSLQQAGYHQASLYLKELKMNCRRTSKVLSFSKSFQCIMDFLPLYQHCRMLCHSTRILFMECCAGRTKVNHLHHFLVWQDSYVSVSV